MLYQFVTSNCDESDTVALFKANSVSEVAEHILRDVCSPKSSRYLEEFMWGFVPYCCRSETISFLGYKDDDKKRKDLVKFFKALTVDEFMEVLSSTHTHSGGDIYEFNISKLPGVINLMQ